ncbi:MAG TPA: hypothetical protein VND64_01520 [Pirellulales bacterium]|nr:hypothetical protein [Pirellulales bacterium]
MTPETYDIPGVTDDPVLRLIFNGEAATLHDAEELFLNASLADIARLIASPMGNDALLCHPLMRLLASHGSRGWEDSLL